MPDVLIRGVSSHLLEVHKERAASNRGSLQGELMRLLERAAMEVESRTPTEIATSIQERLSHTGRTFTNSTSLVRQDRRR